MKEEGYIYVVDGLRWVREVNYAASRLRTLTDYPIAIVCSEEYPEITELSNSLKNLIIIIVPKLQGSDFCSKVIGMQHTPFEKSLFMDSDTFVMYNIDNVFELLNNYDLALTQEPSEHTSLFPIEDKLKNIFIEYNTGVVLYNNSEKVMDLFRDWEQIILTKKYGKDYFDMPQFRNVILNSQHKLNIYTLPENFNMHGLRSYKILFGQVAIIHERFGTYWNSYSEKMLNNKKMLKIATRINSVNSKRIFIPYLNTVVSAERISLSYLIKALKVKFKFRKIPKESAFE